MRLQAWVAVPSVASQHACFLAWACHAAEEHQRRAELSRFLPRLALRLRRTAWAAWAQNTRRRAQKRRRLLTAECYRRLSTLQRAARCWLAVTRRSAAIAEKLEAAFRQRRSRTLLKSCASSDGVLPKACSAHPHFSPHLPSKVRSTKCPADASLIVPNDSSSRLQLARARRPRPPLCRKAPF